MSPRTSGDECRTIVVAGEDKVIAGLVIETLVYDGPSRDIPVFNAS
jgi:hypothetical protein